MKIVVFGATGTIGAAVTAGLRERHEVIAIGKTRGDLQADLTRLADVDRVLTAIGPVDALVSTAGRVHFGPFAELTPEQFEVGLRDKLMGQVNLVLAARTHLKDGGSVTLTTGILAETPIRLGANASLVNAGLEGFVRAAAIELPRSLRVNAVSPSVVAESIDKFAPFFRGFEPVPAARVALAYIRSVEGAQTGQIFKVW